MRTHLLIRGALMLGVALAISAPAFAQTLVRGTVVDGSGKPVEGATVTFEATNIGRKLETKSDRKGEFVQVGLTTGPYRLTASKDNMTVSQGLAVRAGQNPPVTLKLEPTSGLTEEQKKQLGATQAAAAAATEALSAGRDDEAIAKFQEVLAKVPACSDCYFNIGVAYAHKQSWPEAETAFKKVIEMKPDHGGAYAKLAEVYNTTKRFDEAVAASQKATELSGGGAAGGGNPDAMYNQGVTLFNAGKYAEAKTQFEGASKGDPNNANAFYQLGMTSLNLGQMQDAVNALETFLKLAPSDPRAAQVQSTLPAIKGMLK